MGFSVSGSMVVLLLGFFIALSAFYGSFSNTMERVNDARDDSRERVDRIADADLAITSVSLLSDAACGVQVRVNNTGSTVLGVNDTDLLLDNEYRTGWEADAVVDGDSTEREPGTDLWLPGERLTIEEDGLDAAPLSVKVVSGPGVADTREVTTLSCS